MKAILLLFMFLVLISSHMRPVEKTRQSQTENDSCLFTANLLPALKFVLQIVFGKYHHANRIWKHSELVSILSLTMLLSVCAPMISSRALKGKSNNEGILRLSATKVLLDEEDIKHSKLPSFLFNFRCNRYIRILPTTVYPAHLEHYFRAVQSSTTDDDLMKYEWARYASFKHFPSESPVMPSKLAACGFYYIGPSDNVKCFSCQLSYGGWKNGDSPVIIHKRFSPGCGFSEESIQIQEAATADVACADRSKAQHEVCNNEEEKALANDHHNEPRSFTEYCKHPQYKDFSVRLSSFWKWNSCDIQGPHVLAEAGFFYVGFSDCVRCHCCGIGLRNWKYGEGPWQEHARWSADCLFLKQNKNPEFIRKYAGNQHNELISGGACAKPESQSKDTKLGDGKNKISQTEAVKYDAKGKSDCFPEETTKQLLDMGFEQELVAKAVEKCSKEADGSMATCFRLLDIIDSIEKSQKRDRCTASSALQSKPENKFEGKQSAQTTFVENTFKVEKGKQSVSYSADGLSMDCLHEENRRLKDQLICKICMDKNASVVLLPCGHMISCQACSPALRKCPVCRKIVKEKINTV